MGERRRAALPTGRFLGVKSTQTPPFNERSAKVGRFLLFAIQERREVSQKKRRNAALEPNARAFSSSSEQETKNEPARKTPIRLKGKRLNDAPKPRLPST